MEPNENNPQQPPAPTPPNAPEQPAFAPPQNPQQVYGPSAAPVGPTMESPQVAPSYNTSPKSSGKKMKMFISAIGILVIVGILAAVSLILFGKKNTSAVNNLPIKSITVNPSATSGYTKGGSPVTGSSELKGILGTLNYTEVQQQSSQNGGFNVGGYNDVSYVWVTNTISNRNKLNSTQYQSELKQMGYTFTNISAPSLNIKGSNGQTYTLNCQGLISSFTPPAGANAPSTKGSSDICIGYFDNNKELLELAVDISTQQNALTIASQFASGTTINF